MEENQKREKPVDSINEVAKDVVNLVQRTRQLGQIANFVQGILTTLANAAPSTTIFGVIFLFVLIAVLIGSIFIVFIGGAPVAVGGTGGSDTGGSSGGSSPGQVFTCDSGIYSSCLKDTFNISVTGANNTNQLQWIFNAFAYASKSTGYYKALTNGGTLNIVLNDRRRNACAGYTPGPNEIDFGPWTCGAPYSSIRYLIIHESGHAIADRNPRLFQSYPGPTSLSSQDPTCYDVERSNDGGCGKPAATWLVSYPLRYYCKGVCYSDITARNESWADSIADYATYMNYSFPSNHCSIGLSSFKTSCNSTYNWFKENFFENYEF